MELALAEEENIATQCQNKASAMNTYPPLLEYDYQRIGKDYADKLITGKNDNFKEIDTKVEKWLSHNVPLDYCLR